MLITRKRLVYILLRDLENRRCGRPGRWRPVMRRRVPRVRRMANPRAFVAALGALAVLVAFAGAHRAGAPARFQPVARTMRADGSDASAANGRPWKPIVADDEPEEAWYQNPIGRMA